MGAGAAGSEAASAVAVAAAALTAALLGASYRCSWRRGCSAPVSRITGGGMHHGLVYGLGKHVGGACEHYIYSFHDMSFTDAGMYAR